MKKIIFSLVCFTSLFLSMVFGFGVAANNDSNFQQVFYADTNYITTSNLMFDNNMNVEVEPNLLNITTLDPNTSRVLGYDVSYELDTEGRFSFGYYLDLEHCYFDLTYAENQPLYMSVFMTHYGEEFNTRNDYYRMYYTQDKSTLYPVLSDFHAGIDSGTIYSKEVGTGRYYASCFDLSGLDLTKGYLMFLARKDYIVNSQEEYELNMKYSINMVCSRYFDSYNGTTNFVTSCINWLDYAGFDVYNYYDLTSNFIARDVYVWYDIDYDKGYNDGFEDGYQKGLEYYSQPEFKYGNLYNSTWSYKYQINGNEYSSLIPMGSIPDTAYVENGISLSNLFSLAAEKSGNGTFEIYISPPKNITGQQSYTFLNYSFDTWYAYSFGAMLNDNYVYTSSIPIVPLEPSRPITGSRSYSFDVEIDTLVFNCFYNSKNDYGYLTNMSGLDAAILDSAIKENYKKGYDVGRENGFNDGFKKGKEQGYTQGFNDGYNSVVNDGNTLVGMIFAVVDAPFKVLKDSMNFNFLGINVADFIFSALTMIIVIKVFKIILGK